MVKHILANAPGSTIFLGCRDLDAGRRVAKEVLEEGTVTVIPVCLDVTSSESVCAAAEAVRAEVPHLDLLCNNAGILHENFSEDSARQTLQTNFEGPILVTSAFLPMMRDGASILFTSSGMGARTLGLLSAEHRDTLLLPDAPAARA